MRAVFGQTAYQQRQSPIGSEFFLAIWPTGRQDIGTATINRPYDGPDAKLCQIELLRSSLVSGMSAYDLPRPYAMMAANLPIGLPEDAKPGITELYNRSDNQQSLVDNIMRFTGLIG